LEYLSNRIWITPELANLVLYLPKKWEIDAPRMKQYRDNGTSLQVIAHMFNTSRNQVVDLISYAEAGKLPPVPKHKKRKQKRGGGRSISKTERFEELITQLRETKKMPFRVICKYIEKNCSESISIDTVTRAYDRARPDALLTAATEGRRVDRGHHRGLSSAVHERIRQLLSRNLPPGRVAQLLGVGESTVRREQNELR
jgi:hypothetical protein